MVEVCIRRAVYPCVYREHGKEDEIKKFIHGLSLCIQGTHEFDDEL